MKKLLFPLAFFALLYFLYKKFVQKKRTGKVFVDDVAIIDKAEYENGVKVNLQDEEPLPHERIQALYHQNPLGVLDVDPQVQVTHMEYPNEVGKFAYNIWNPGEKDLGVSMYDHIPALPKGAALFI